MRVYLCFNVVKNNGVTYVETVELQIRPERLASLVEVKSLTFRNLQLENEPDGGKNG